MDYKMPFLEHIKLQNFIRQNNKDEKNNIKAINEKAQNILKNIDELIKNGENEKEYYIIKAYCYKAQKKYPEACTLAQFGQMTNSGLTQFIANIEQISLISKQSFKKFYIIFLVLHIIGLNN